MDRNVSERDSGEVRLLRALCAGPRNDAQQTLPGFWELAGLPSTIWNLEKSQLVRA